MPIPDSAFSPACVLPMLEQLMCNHVAATPFTGTLSWPANLYVGLCEAIDDSALATTGYYRVAATFGASNGINCNEPDIGTPFAINCGVTGNGYTRFKCGPAWSGTQGATTWWGALGGSNFGVISNKGAAITFTHSTNASGTTSCGGTLTASGLPWGYCTGSAWSPYVFKYFFITDIPTGTQRGSAQNIIAYGLLTYPKPVYAGDVLSFAADSLKINLASCA